MSRSSSKKHKLKNLNATRKKNKNRHVVKIEKVSTKKFFEFFKWFDITVGEIFEELVPRTSRYLGTNFVIENHVLERPKFRYSYFDIYMGEIDRRNPGLIFLQQFIGTLKKF